MDASLQEFIEDVNGTGHLRIEHDFGDGFVRLQTSEAERRQAAQDIRCSENIVLEMLRNSRDAHASHIFVALAREGSKRIITVIDDGCGIPESMHSLVFEPRVTSKLDTSHMDAWGLHGRGMALYSISVNAVSAEVADSAPDLGCSMRVVSDLSTLPEKTDQSSFPTFELSEDGSVNVRGPRNILRTVCEFAIESRANCSVFVGSPAEISATMYAYGLSTLAAIDRIFCKDEREIPLTKRLATAGDPATFAELAGSMGLELSERTARRALDGEVAEVDPILDRVVLTKSEVASSKGTKRKGRSIGSKGIRLSADDAQALKEATMSAFADIAEAYYLEGDVEPSVRVRPDRITISIPTVPSS